MRKIEQILERSFHGRAMQKDPDRAVHRCALEIVRTSDNLRVPAAICTELLGCCEAWLRRHVTAGSGRGHIPLFTIRAFMAEVKAHAHGGAPEDYRHEHNLDVVSALVCEAFAAAGNEAVEPSTVFSVYAPRLLLASGDRFLSRDQVVLALGCPIRSLTKRQSMLTPLDLTMGRNKRRPFRRYSYLEALAKREQLETC